MADTSPDTSIDELIEAVAAVQRLNAMVDDHVGLLRSLASRLQAVERRLDSLGVRPDSPAPPPTIPPSAGKPR